MEKEGKHIYQAEHLDSKVRFLIEQKKLHSITDQTVSDELKVTLKIARSALSRVREVK